MSSESTNNTKKSKKVDAPHLADDIRTFYVQHNPAKVPGLPILLEKYRGKHAKLFASLKKKYNVTSDQKDTKTKAKRPAQGASGGGSGGSGGEKRDLPEETSAQLVDYEEEDDDDEDDKVTIEGTKDVSGRGAASSTDNPPPNKRQKKGAKPKSTIFCCTKCGRDCLEAKEPITIASLKRRDSDKSAVLPENKLLKMLRVVQGSTTELQRRGKLERQFKFLCRYCSTPLGYRHRPLATPVEFCYFQRGSIISSKSTRFGETDTAGSDIGAEESTTLVCHVTPGTNKACITQIDDKDEVQHNHIQSNTTRHNVQVHACMPPMVAFAACVLDFLSYSYPCNTLTTHMKTHTTQRIFVFALCLCFFWLSHS